MVVATDKPFQDVIKISFETGFIHEKRTFDLNILIRLNNTLKALEKGDCAFLGTVPLPREL